MGLAVIALIAVAIIWLSIYLVGDETAFVSLLVSVTLAGLGIGGLFLTGALSHPSKKAIQHQRLGTGIQPNPACGTSQPDNGPC